MTKGLPEGWEDPLERLRLKWGTVPGGNDRRASSSDFLRLDDQSLLEAWERAHRHDTLGEGFGIRGWFHETYRSYMPGKRILDVGCGMAISTLDFALMGAKVTFTDIVEENVLLVERLCKLKEVSAEFLYIDKFEDFDTLEKDYDCATAIGSLINAPLAVIKREISYIAPRIKPGGRFLHFAYPRSRWEREGSPLLEIWGEMTDGPGTPWMEWHDKRKIVEMFHPREIRVIFDCEWHNSDFNWFDIELH